jgi:vitamin B12 transporter
VPGLNIVQTGGPGGQTSVFMRGTNANHVKVLIDGIDVSNPSTPNAAFDFAHLMTGDIARIEVLRGPQSGLYGSDAIGGVISIVTQKGEGPAQAYASAEAGSFGTFNQATGVSGASQGFNYAFNIAHYRADDIPVTPLYLVPPGESRLDNSYDNMTYSTKLGFEVSKDLTLNFVARYVDSTYHLNGLFNFCATCSLPFVQEPQESTQINRQFWTRGEAVWSLFDGRFKNYFGLAYTDAWTHVVDPWPGDASNSTSEGQRIKYDWRGVAELAPGQLLLTGVERQNESVDTFPGTFRTGDSAVWTQLQSEWAKRFFLVSNIRYDDNDSFGSHTTWRVAGAVILPDIDTKLKASYGTGFKAPSLSDLYVSFPPFFFANPNLRPEESEGYDAGFEQPLFNDRIRFGATYFHNDITNLINFNNTFTSLINVGRATTYGTESFVSFAITTDLKLRADYTYLIARDDITGEELLRRPKNKVSVTSSWKATDDLTLSATILHVGSWEEQAIANNSVPMFAAPGYTTVNLAASYAATDKVTLFGRIDNLFNEHYEDPAGFLRPGIGVFAGIKVNIDVANLAGELK